MLNLPAIYILLQSNFVTYCIYHRNLQLSSGLTLVVGIYLYNFKISFEKNSQASFCIFHFSGFIM